MSCTRSVPLSTRGWLALTASSAAIAFGQTGCQDTEERPPLLGCSVDVDASCGHNPGTGSGGGTRDGSTQQPTDAGTSLDVVSRVVMLADDLSTTLPFTNAAKVYAEGERGSFVTADYTGLSDFTLRGVAVRDMVWAGARPASSTGPALPTLVALDTRSGIDPFPLIRTDTIDGIYQRLTLPTQRASGRGQVIVYFVRDDSQRPPMVGVTASIDGAETRVYDTGGGYTDNASGTGPFGIAILVNIPAPPFPGAKFRLLWGGSAEPASADVFVAADSVTFVGFLATPS